MPLILIAIAAGIVALAHTAPFPFLLEYMGPGRSVWHLPSPDGRPTVYLTYDDGPNPTATPQLLDVLEQEQVPATFFIIPEHVTAGTARIVWRAAAAGHGVALHASTRALMLKSPEAFARHVVQERDRVEALSGARPCEIFRPHAGWRGGPMYEGLDRAGFTLGGWSFGMWDWNWWRPARPEKLASRLASRADDGDIVVMHDGHHKNPRAERLHTVRATADLIPRLKARGFRFGELCAAVRAGRDE
jgi:peptidoglycan/xylan/chitin deacetylase (PgdA/CDA1 family)